MYDEKDIQLDGALVQGGGHDRYERDSGNGMSVPSISGEARYGVYYQYNWLHDSLNLRSSKRGLRFDRSQHICSGLENNTWPFHGVMLKNVVWNTAGVMAKGNDHLVARNTVFDTGSGHGGTTDDEGSALSDFTMYHAYHEGTCQCDKDYCINSRTHSFDGATDMCCVPGDNGTFEGLNNQVIGNALEAYGEAVGGGIATPSTAQVDSLFDIPGAVDNSAGHLFENLRDPHNWDFRPKPGSIFAQRGIGAYDVVESGGLYRIPGRREWQASTPVPPDGATNVKVDADMMFLPAFGYVGAALGHRVFIGCSQQRVLEAALQAEADNAPVDLAGESNVLAPPSNLMQRSQTIFWRVDAVMRVNATHNATHFGKMWSFSVEPPPPPPPPPPPLCSKYHSPAMPIAMQAGFQSNGWLDVPGMEIASYPSGWMLASATLCTSLSYSATPSGTGECNTQYPGALGALQVRLKIPGADGQRLIMNKEGFDETVLDQACFTDSADNDFPSQSSVAEAAAPFNATWQPNQAFFTYLDDHGVGYDEEFHNSRSGNPKFWAPEVQLKLKDHCHNQCPSKAGSITAWSLELCYTPPPVPAPEPEPEPEPIPEEEPWCLEPDPDFSSYYILTADDCIAHVADSTCSNADTFLIGFNADNPNTNTVSKCAAECARNSACTGAFTFGQGAHAGQCRLRHGACQQSGSAEWKLYQLIGAASYAGGGALACNLIEQTSHAERIYQLVHWDQSVTLFVYPSGVGSDDRYCLYSTDESGTGQLSWVVPAQTECTRWISTASGGITLLTAGSLSLIVTFHVSLPTKCSGNTYPTLDFECGTGYTYRSNSDSTDMNGFSSNDNRAICCDRIFCNADVCTLGYHLKAGAETTLPAIGVAIDNSECCDADVSGMCSGNTDSSLDVLCGVGYRDSANKTAIAATGSTDEANNQICCDQIFCESSVCSASHVQKPDATTTLPAPGTAVSESVCCDPCGSQTHCFVDGTACVTGTSTLSCTELTTTAADAGYILDADGVVVPPTDVDCAGSWSECTHLCEPGSLRLWSESVAQSGAGESCPNAEDCKPGDGTCPCNNQTGCASPAPPGNACSTIVPGAATCLPGGGNSGYFVDTNGTAVICVPGTFSAAGEDSTSGCDACTSQTGCILDATGCSSLPGLEFKLLCDPDGGADGYYVDDNGTATECQDGTYSPARAAPTSGCAPVCDAFTCMGNGQCYDGACVCDSGWKGSSCSVLDLAPVRDASPGWRSDQVGWRPSWGGGAIFENDKWHLIAGVKDDLTDEAPDSFGDNCGVYRLESTGSDVGGPYEMREKITNGFRADLKRLSDGTLGFMSSGCTSGACSGTEPGFGFMLVTSDTGSVHGPWTRHLLYQLSNPLFFNQTEWPGGGWLTDSTNSDPTRWDCKMADPTFTELTDGRVIVGYRGTPCQLPVWPEYAHEIASMLVCESWQGPCVRSGVKIFGDPSNNEDMYLWSSSRGIHMLMHSQLDDHNNHKRRGAYAFSPDGLPHTWVLSSEEAWTTYLAYDNCSVSTITKRQRPSLAFDPVTGAPTHLLTGVSTTADGLTWGDGWTSVQPLLGASIAPVDCGPCCDGPCLGGYIGSADSCSPCPEITNCREGRSAGRPLFVDVSAEFGPRADACVCLECEEGWLGDYCETADPPSSAVSCWNQGSGSGTDLVPGTGNGEVFRCGHLETDENGVAANAGFWGHCVAADARCNGIESCGDAADERSCEEGDMMVSCKWPKSSDVTLGHVPAGWTRVFRQTAGLLDSYRSASDWQRYNADDAEAPNFSRLDELERWRQSDGKFTLKLVWPQREGANSNTWRQTTNPVTSASTAGVEGYEPVDIHFTENTNVCLSSDGNFRGLERSDGYALLDGSVGGAALGCTKGVPGECCYFYAIGSESEWSGGLAGSDQPEQEVELYAFAPSSCKLCSDTDIPKCLPGEVVPVDGGACTCQKCMSGWSGTRCELTVPDVSSNITCSSDILLTTIPSYLSITDFSAVHVITAPEVNESAVMRVVWRGDACVRMRRIALQFDERTGEAVVYLPSNGTIASARQAGRAFTFAFRVLVVVILSSCMLMPVHRVLFAICSAIRWSLQRCPRSQAGFWHAFALATCKCGFICNSSCSKHRGSA